MRILVLGGGLQGRAAVYDLVRSPLVSHVVAADIKVGELVDFVAQLETDKVRVVQVDANDAERVAELMRDVQAVASLLPPKFGASLAPLAVAEGIHWVDASYTQPIYRELSEEAEGRGLAILPEFGLDPGIDLLLAAEAISEFDEVHEFFSYGAGIPEPEAADNPLQYRISWSFGGVLDSYTRTARMITDGRAVEISGEELFDASNVHKVEIRGLGRLEAYPNGDAVRYVRELGLELVRQAGRYSMRWPGHASIWRALTKMGFLGEEPIQFGDVAISPRQFTRQLLEPKLRYGPEQRDVAIVRVDIRGLKRGRTGRVLLQLLDFRDLETGLLAMQRTVGFTVSIGAQMILSGHIRKRGLLSPISDVDPQPVLEALRRRGINVSSQRSASED